MSTTSGETAPAAPASRRLAFIDAIRGVAILAMVVYHAAFDLSLYRLFGVSIIEDPAWTAFARAIAGTFVALVGFNLALAHARGLNLRRFLVRLAVLAVLAGVVSAATWFSDPGTFVYFGILHQIALASLAGLAFLRRPLLVVLTAAAIAFALPYAATSPLFDAPWFWWLGLSEEVRPSIDFVPFLPWFGVTLLGLAAGRLFLARGTGSAIARWQPTSRSGRALTLAGRWTLAIYMVHQPILVGIVMLIAPLSPPDIAGERARFVAACTPSCAGSGEACETYCTCLFEDYWDTDLYAIRTLEEMTDDQRDRWDASILACSAAFDPVE